MGADKGFRTGSNVLACEFPEAVDNSPEVEGLNTFDGGLEGALGLDGRLVVAEG